jgi:putative salt-induced outer membrane protein YdiY
MTRLHDWTDADVARARLARQFILEGGRHLTRDELRTAIGRAGISTERLQRMAYIMMHAELTGVATRAPAPDSQSPDRQMYHHPMLSRPALVVLLSCPSVAFAQAAAPLPPPRHESSGEFAFVGVSGNASSTTIGLGYETVARPATWVFRHRLSFVRNESEGVPTAQALLFTPRVEKTIDARVSAFGEYAYFRDRFAGVANRHSVNGGVAMTLVSSARQKLTADLGAGHLTEARLTGDDVSSATYTTGTVYVLTLSDTAEVSDRLGLTGTFDNADDWRLEHTIALTAKLTSIMSLKVSNAVRYSNFPAPGFERTDTITSVALVASFKSR